MTRAIPVGLFAIGAALLVAGESARAQEPVAVGGVEHLYRLSPRLYSGAQPEGDAGLAALKALGIKTITSVDGSRPDVEAARRLGLRYVHLPVGYDGIPRAQALRLIRAIDTLPGPILIHCHHGKHRGPAAAALGCRATEGWTADRAKAWLERAGTSPNYRGLFDAVGAFRVPTPAELAAVNPALPEHADTPAFVDLMVQIDAVHDRLKAIQSSGFRPPADHPDLDPPGEALLLAEHFREARRLDEARAAGGDFLRDLQASERAATDLERALRDPAGTPEIRSRAGAALRELGHGCTSCHARSRDNRPGRRP